MYYVRPKCPHLIVERFREPRRQESWEKKWFPQLGP